MDTELKWRVDTEWVWRVGAVRIDRDGRAWWRDGDCARNVDVHLTAVKETNNDHTILNRGRICRAIRSRTRGLLAQKFISRIGIQTTGTHLDKRRQRRLHRDGEKSTISPEIKTYRHAMALGTKPSTRRGNCNRKLQRPRTNSRCLDQSIATSEASEAYKRNGIRARMRGSVRIHAWSDRDSNY